MRHPFLDWSSNPEPTVKFDAAAKRTTVELRRPLTAEVLEAISEHVRQHEPRCIHVMVSGGWQDPQATNWNDPRRVSQIEKVLPPSLEAFIFDTHYDTVARQSSNTLGDIADVLEACPGLQRAFITGCSSMRKTRHEQIRELHLLGNRLDPSVIPALGSSSFPALDRLVLSQEGGLDPVTLAQRLRDLDAPRLSEVCIDGVPVFEFLPPIGAAPLQWTLCVSDPGLDEVDQLLGLLGKHNALCSGRLQLCSEKLFDDEVAKLAEMGVAVRDWRAIFLPKVYENW